MAGPGLLSTPAAIDSPGIRHAGRGLLSLALMDARNHTLSLLARLEEARLQRRMAPHEGPAALWIAGHTAWFSEYWIGRNVQRAQGSRCPPEPTRIASIEPRADDWWQPGAPPAADAPDGDAVRAFLLETLEGTLDLLDRAAEDDESLYFYRLALLHEDQRGEQLVELAQAAGVALGLPEPAVFAPRSPVLLPATRWTLGTPAGGFRFDNEIGPHEVDVPEFEIDAQPVSWAQFVEFVDDGGYDRPELWSEAGQAWLAGQIAQGQRGLRHVEQVGAGSGAVMQHRFGRLVRQPGERAAVHLAWWEAEAWARWAGRRLATEVEWEIAAHQGATRGFRWGEVHEWTAGTLRPWPGFEPGPWRAYSEPWFGRARVLRGASFATRARLVNARQRGFALPDRSDRFTGFRTCAL